NTWMFPTEKKSYMGGLEDRPILAKSAGVMVTDIDGKQYLDFQSGQMGAALGHQHPRVVKRITDTLKQLMHASNAMLNVPRLKLHEKLGKLLPKPLQKTLFLVSGSDSIEASVDLARKATGGLDVLGFHTGLHGSTSYLTRSLSFAWSRSKHSILAPATSPIHPRPSLLWPPVGPKTPQWQAATPKAELRAAGPHLPAKPRRFHRRAGAECRRRDRTSARLLQGPSRRTRAPRHADDIR